MPYQSGALQFTGSFLRFSGGGGGRGGGWDSMTILSFQKVKSVGEKRFNKRVSMVASAIKNEKNKRYIT